MRYAAGASAALQALPVCLGPAAAAAPLLGACSVWRLPGVFGGAGGAVLALGGCRSVFGGQGLNGTPHVLLSSCVCQSLLIVVGRF